MVVGDDDVGVVHQLTDVRREQLTLVVVVAVLARLKYAQPVADGDAGRDDEKSLREARVAWGDMLVHSLPGDEHGHDDSLAGSGGHLESDPRKPEVEIVVEGFDAFAPVGVGVATCDLVQEDRNLGSLALTEEHTLLPVRVRPMQQQLAGHRRDPLVALPPPLVDLTTKFVDQAVCLALFRSALELQFLLERSVGTLPGLRDWNERLARPTAVDDLAGWPELADLPVLGRRVVRPVDDRVDERGRSLVVGCHRNLPKLELTLSTETNRVKRTRR